MQTKLTLRLEDHLIAQAKDYAQASGKSLSQMVAEYFARLEKPAPALRPLPPPFTRLLRNTGCHAGPARQSFR